ncbi:MAG TPA: DNA polymerase Y family protein, partial [Polyangia bacterium]|nr:DNA polymerase Y family protein [Polyangia bacterium]
MDRLACVDLPSLPLQLLRRRHPDWATRPVAVVESDKPLAKLLWVNENARAAGVRVGQRYASALALCSSLRAGAVAPSEIATTIAALTEKLRALTPHIEPSTDEPGVFWLDAGGLDWLYPSLTSWAQRIRRLLADADGGGGFVAMVAVGFSRFGVYAAAKRGGVVVFTSPDEEARVMRSVPLDRIGIAPDVRDRLAQLAVRTVGDFLALPPAGILKRFGPDAHRLHRLGAGALWAPLQPTPYVEPLVHTLELDDAEANLESLLFLVKQALDPLLVKLATRGQALAEVTLTLTLDPHGGDRRGRGSGTLDSHGGDRRAREPGPPEKQDARVEHIRPAAPTLDSAQLLNLVRLRLESLQLTTGVVRLATAATGVPASPEQLKMFAHKPRRDLAAAARAIARLRAALGEQAVVRARLCEGHLPEARFTWEPIDAVAPARPRPLPQIRPVVRRIAARPIAL